MFLVFLSAKSDELQECNDQCIHPNLSVVNGKEMVNMLRIDKAFYIFTLTSSTLKKNLSLSTSDMLSFIRRNFSFLNVQFFVV